MPISGLSRVGEYDGRWQRGVTAKMSDGGETTEAAGGRVSQSVSRHTSTSATATKRLSHTKLVGSGCPLTSGAHEQSLSWRRHCLRRRSGTSVRPVDLYQNSGFTPSVSEWWLARAGCRNRKSTSYVLLQFFSEPWVCTIYCWSGMAPWWLLVMPDRRCGTVLKEFTDGVDLAELGREFQSETVLGKKENL